MTAAMCTGTLTNKGDEKKHVLSYRPKRGSEHTKYDVGRLNLYFDTEAVPTHFPLSLSTVKEQFEATGTVLGNQITCGAKPVDCKTQSSYVFALQ